MAGHPWGRLDWILEGASVGGWSVIACLSPEERWSAALEAVLKLDKLEHQTLIRIEPAGLGHHRALGHALMGKQIEVAKQLVAHDGEVHQLFERHEDLARGIRRFVQAAGANVLIDISCFPKRFFFPIMKLVLAESKASNVVVCYTHAGEYATASLSEDPEPASPLPMFMGALAAAEAETLVIAAGAEALGLSQILDGDGGFGRVKVLYPFPAPPPLGRRNWDFLRVVMSSTNIGAEDLIGIDPNDVPRVFASIEKIGGTQPEALTLAPYGPKPVSLAMCLYALALQPERRPAVIYTQPKCYNPAYSTGVSMRQGEKRITGYAVRLAGESLYQPSSL